MAIDKTNNNVGVSFRANGLIRKEIYNYTFEGLGGNWPAIITPLSGTFFAESKQQDISGVVRFCPTTGMCPDGTYGLLPSDIQCGFNSQNLFSLLRVSYAPSTGGDTIMSPLQKVDCENCLPKISTVINPLDSILTESSGNNILIQYTIVGLQPNETYSYSFNSIDANWPVSIVPMSGIFRPSQETFISKTLLTFYPSTGLLDPQNSLQPTQDLSFNIDPSNMSFLFSSLELEVSPVSCDGHTIISDPITVVCNECLPKLQIFLPTTPITLAGPNNACHDIVASVSGLIRNESYNYEFMPVSANWPVVITPMSGIIHASKKSAEIRARLVFCPSTMLCPTGTPGLLDYDISSYQYLFDSQCGKFVSLKLAVGTASVNTSDTVYSDNVSIHCVDCLGALGVPKLTITTKSQP